MRLILTRHGETTANKDDLLQGQLQGELNKLGKLQAKATANALKKEKIDVAFTSDLKRNLFYGEAFWKHGFKVYDMTPLEIDPNFNITDPLSGLLAYPNTTYDYPTVQLVFWAIIAPLPFADIIAKWIFSFFDLINFMLLFYLMKQVNTKQNKDNLESNRDWSLIIIPFIYLGFSIIFANSKSSQ